jgi:hypothetical protein
MMSEHWIEAKKWTEAVMVDFGVLLLQLPEGTDEKHDVPSVDTETRR